jgi:hypothetical protein
MEKVLMLQEVAIMARIVGEDVGVVIEMGEEDMKMTGGIIITKGSILTGMIGGGKRIGGEMMIDNMVEIDDMVEIEMIGGEVTVPEIEDIERC